jgi:hypothetical protein
MGTQNTILCCSRNAVQDSREAVSKNRTSPLFQRTETPSRQPGTVQENMEPMLDQQDAAPTLPRMRAEQFDHNFSFLLDHLNADDIFEIGFDPKFQC